MGQTKFSDICEDDFEIYNVIFFNLYFILVTITWKITG